MNRSRIGDTIAAAGRNAVVVAGVATSTWSAPAAMVLYLIENVIAIVLAGIRVRVQAPEPGRSKVLSTYWMIAGGFTVVEAVFVLFVVLHILEEPLTFRRMAEPARKTPMNTAIGLKAAVDLGSLIPRRETS